MRPRADTPSGKRRSGRILPVGQPWCPRAAGPKPGLSGRSRTIVEARLTSQPAVLAYPARVPQPDARFPDRLALTPAGVRLVDVLVFPPTMRPGGRGPRTLPPAMRGPPTAHRGYVSQTKDRLSRLPALLLGVAVNCADRALVRRG